MHFCVSDHVSEWLSQIVLDKVHLRQEIDGIVDHRGEIRCSGGWSHGEKPLPISSPSQKRRSPARGERSFLGSFGGTGDGREPITTVMYASRVS